MQTSTPSGSARLAATPMIIKKLGFLDYHLAWQQQRELAELRSAGLGHDTLLLLEHPSVYTAGRRTEPQDRPSDGTPVVDVDRGGKITWHGPGQLVGYPIVALAEPIDVVNYVRRLEEALISVCNSFGIECGRVEGRSGVWLPARNYNDNYLPERKIAAIGVRVQRGVALHGFSLNCNCDLTPFSAIIPCGIANVGVTSLSHEIGREVAVSEVLPLAEQAICAALDGTLGIATHHITRLAPTERSGSAITTLQLG
ncbi:MAG: lipoyl(octanoyl) transferase LipB [Mycobacteriaceae bacterium]